jgi:NarL family two-component system response regulator YdfI
VTRVLVAADSVVVRAGLEALLARSGALIVAASVPGGPDLARQVMEAHPDVVLLELEQHETEPLALLRALAVRVPETAIVVLAGDDREGWTMEALRAGVRAVLPREATEAEIVAAIEAAAAGFLVLPAAAVDALLPLARSASRPRAAGDHQPLTPREIEILNLLAEGLGNKAIAPRLGISEHTVKFHLASIFTKLGVSTRTEAVTMGARMGVILL